MDFFDAQDHARRLSRRLVLLFALSVISLVAVTNLLVMVTLGVLEADPQGGPQFRFDPAMAIAVTLGVIGVIVLSSLYRIMTLRKGGAAVAEMLQGRLVVEGRNSVAEQRLLNVVEEMAIAAGTPVPPVYIIEEPGINAFAAGYAVSDAVIGVTRGAVEKLTRDELQGVIAHEFSHILHGDMRLNIRLIGLLHGIMMLGMAGYYLLRTGGAARRSRDTQAVVILALGLIVIGATGMFFGSLIKAAVSRQREYLADASAVQYTRNYAGIAGALKRIGAEAEGSLMQHPATTEISHSLFGAGTRLSLSGMFATHPPLKKRIRKLEPGWNGEYPPPVTAAPGNGAPSRRPQSGEHQQPDDSTARQRAGAAGMGLAMATAAAFQRIGDPDEQDIEYARELYQQLPASLLQAAHEPDGARALIYLLLLVPDSKGQQTQLQLLDERVKAGLADAQVSERLKSLLADSDVLRVEHRLPLINIALASLRQLTASQYQAFSATMEQLAVTPVRHLRNWLVHNLVRHHLDRSFEQTDLRLTDATDRTLAASSEAVSVLMSLCVHLGGATGITAGQHFATAMQGVPVSSAELLDASSLSLQRLDDAMAELRQLSATDKQLLLTRLAVCIEQDGRVTVVEQELIRTVAEILDCPLPASL